MSRRRKVEKWLNVEPRRILETSSSSSNDGDDESIADSSGCSSILPSNMSLFTSQLILTAASHSTSIATQVNEDDLTLQVKSVATQTTQKVTKKVAKQRKLPKLKELTPSFDFSTPKVFRENNLEILKIFQARVIHSQ